MTHLEALDMAITRAELIHQSETGSWSAGQHISTVRQKYAERHIEQARVLKDLRAWLKNEKDMA